jgi:dihydropteroate synthase
MSRSLGRGLSWSIRRALSLGVKRSQLIIDPGLGFGKTRVQNFEILAHLELLKRFHLPVMIGASRKSFIQAIVSGEQLDRLRQKTSANENPSRNEHQRRSAEKTAVQRSSFASALDFGDAAAAVAAVLGGAHIVRVHCVRAIIPAVRIADAILASEAPPPEAE